MNITSYGHRLSQPCRAVEILLHELGYSHTAESIDFAQGQTHERWYIERINAFATVPALVVTATDPTLDETPTTLGESHAILRFLCRSADNSEAAEAWYPSDRDPLYAGRIDQWLDWHHAHIRAYDLFHDLMNLHLTLPMLKREIQSDRFVPLQRGLRRGLDGLEQQLTVHRPTDTTPTLCGSAHPTIADLAIGCELYQIKAVGYRFDAYPNVVRWLAGLSDRPCFRDISREIDAQGQSIREQDGAHLALDTAFS